MIDTGNKHKSVCIAIIKSAIKPTDVGIDKYSPEIKRPNTPSIRARGTLKKIKSAFLYFPMIKKVLKRLTKRQVVLLQIMEPMRVFFTVHVAFPTSIV